MKTYTIGRQIDVFDNITESLVEEIEMESFDLKLMKSRFKIRRNDPLMYAPYEIDATKADLFPNVKFDFEKYSYYVAAYQIPLPRI